MSTETIINSVVLTKSQLIEAVRDYLINNNIEGAEKTFTSLQLNTGVNSLDQAQDGDTVLTFNIVLRP